MPNSDWLIKECEEPAAMADGSSNSNNYKHKLHRLGRQSSSQSKSVSSVSMATRSNGLNKGLDNATNTNKSSQPTDEATGNNWMTAFNVTYSHLPSFSLLVQQMQHCFPDVAMETRSDATTDKSAVSANNYNFPNCPTKLAHSALS